MNTKLVSALLRELERWYSAAGVKMIFANRWIPRRWRCFGYWGSAPTSALDLGTRGGG